MDAPNDDTAKFIYILLIDLFGVTLIVYAYYIYKLLLLPFVFIISPLLPSIEWIVNTFYFKYSPNWLLENKDNKNNKLTLYSSNEDYLSKMD